MTIQSSSAIFLSGLLALSFADTLASQQPAPASTLHVTSSLVLVDVVARDHDRPVHGLDRAHVHILDYGREQPITIFEEHQPGAQVPTALSIPLSAGMHTNLPATSGDHVPSVLLLDALNTQAEDQMRVRHQMLQYLTTLKPGTTLAIFTFGATLRQLTGFTTDVAVLSEAIRSKESQPVRTGLYDPEVDRWMDHLINLVIRDGFDKQLQKDLLLFQTENYAQTTDKRVAMTAEALTILARYLSGIPGRKNLLWFAGSFRWASSRMRWRCKRTT